jgi:phosphatidylserine/phosphatidylglycerophosphate/cardiolipin synthase-like enzyme
VAFIHNDRRAPPKSFDFVTVETNSWRIAKASRASLIVDADDYFRAGRLAMLSAKRRIMLIGWDFDARIDLDRESELEGPSRLGDFVLWLVKRRPDLEIYLLRWDLGAIPPPQRRRTGARWRVSWRRSPDTAVTTQRRKRRT